MSVESSTPTKRTRENKKDKKTNKKQKVEHTFIQSDIEIETDKLMSQQIITQTLETLLKIQSNPVIFNHLSEDRQQQIKSKINKMFDKIL